MSTQLNSSGITFPDATTQTTAATSIDNTAYTVRQYSITGYGPLTVGTSYSAASVGMPYGTWVCLGYYSNDITSYDGNSGSNINYTFYHSLIKRTA